jgi:hypothetical protein
MQPFDNTNDYTLLKPQNTSSKDDKSATLHQPCHYVLQHSEGNDDVMDTGFHYFGHPTTLQIMKAILIDVSNQCLQLMMLECT